MHTVLLLIVIVTAGQSAAPPACRAWQECRQAALEAADRGDFQQFHDLAWKAVQLGPPKNTDLIYLLARAQVLSGRPHDALIMLERLADMGVATEAATSDEFARTRELPGWADVEAILAGKPKTAQGASAPPRAGAASRSAGGPTPAASPSSAISSGKATKPFPIEPRTTSTAARFSANRFADAGLAYDAVSRRFVVGDSRDRKLMVIGVDGDHSTDMVRAESAGFHDVAALDIDDRRGDLWVASTQGDTSALHRLQLVSGRPLHTYQTGSSIGRATITDLAVAPSGAIMALDAAGRRVLTLARDTTDMTVTMGLSVRDPSSLTATSDEGIVYVAHADGISRVDLKARTAQALTAGAGFDLRGFVRIRLAGNSLVGLQTATDGALQLVRLDLSSNGRNVTDAAVIDPKVTVAGTRPFIAIAEGDLYYLSAETAPADSGSGSPMTVAVRRVRVR